MAVVREYGNELSSRRLLVTKGMKVPKRVSDIFAWFKEAKKALKSERCFDDVKRTTATMESVIFRFDDDSCWVIARKENSLGMR